jgi:Protein of unknown function (DUF3102)
LEDGLSKIAQAIIAKSAQLDALKQRINEEHRRCEEAVGSALEHAINAGEGLVQMKDNLSHGTWGRWLRENFEGSERTAQAYMRLYRRRDEIRNGAADLSIRGALSSLSVPKPEPAETVEEDTVPSIPAGEVSPSVPYPPNAFTRERAEGPLQWAHDKDDMDLKPTVAKSSAQEAVPDDGTAESRELGTIEQLEKFADGREALAEVNKEYETEGVRLYVRGKIIDLGRTVREITPEEAAKREFADHAAEMTREVVKGQHIQRKGRITYLSMHLERARDARDWLNAYILKLEEAEARLYERAGGE